MSSERPEYRVEDLNILIIGQQVSTNFETYIDLLGIDREGNAAIVELKRGRSFRLNKTSQRRGRRPRS